MICPRRQNERVVELGFKAGWVSLQTLCYFYYTTLPLATKIIAGEERVWTHTTFKCNHKINTFLGHLPTVFYHPESQIPLFLCLVTSPNLLPFVKIVHTPLDWTTSLGFRFFSVKPHALITINTSVICMPFLLLICILLASFAEPRYRTKG